MRRRSFLAACAASAAAGCFSEEPQPAHTVSVYNADRETERNVTVTVEDGDGNSLFDRRYALSDANEADEDATFPASTEPETVTVTVDGRGFERDWPGFEQPELPCEGENEAGVEVWVEGGENTTVRLEPNCGYVTPDGG